jgi:hypothetical protein
MDTIQDSVDRYSDGRYYSPSGRRKRRGAWWALVVVPVATFAAQYGISVLMLKTLDTPELLRPTSPVAPFLGLFMDSTFVLLSLACVVIGAMVVFASTDAFMLTIGYVGVRWLLGYVLSVLATPALLTSAGLQIGYLAPPPHHAKPGHAQLIPGSNLRSFRTVNSQGIRLQIDGRRLGLALPRSLAIGGRQVSLSGSVTRLTCVRAHAPALTLGPRRYRAGADSVSWILPGGRAALRGCSGTMTLATAGQAQQNGPEIAGFKLAPWKIRLR